MTATVAAMIAESPWVDKVIYQDDDAALVTRVNHADHHWVLYVTKDGRNRGVPFESNNPFSFQCALITATRDKARNIIDLRNAHI